MSQVLVLVRDLMFASKIGGAAQALGLAIKIIRDPGKLAPEAGDRLIVDLNQPGALEAGVAWKAAHGLPVIGFVAHTDGETIAQARAGGIDEVLARSAFVQRLPELLRASPSPGTPGEGRGEGSSG